MVYQISVIAMSKCNVYDVFNIKEISPDELEYAVIKKCNMAKKEWYTLKHTITCLKNQEKILQNWRVQMKHIRDSEFTFPCGWLITLLSFKLLCLQLFKFWIIWIFYLIIKFELMRIYCIQIQIKTNKTRYYLITIVKNYFYYMDLK